MTDWKTVKIPAFLIRSAEIVNQNQGYESRADIVRSALRMLIDSRVEHLFATQKAFPEHIKILKELREHYKSD